MGSRKEKRPLSSLLPMRMTASSADGHLVNIPAVMISFNAGERLLAAMQSVSPSQHVFLKFMPENPGEQGCPESDNSPNKRNYKMSDKNLQAPEPILRTDQAGGRLFITHNGQSW